MALVTRPFKEVYDELISYVPTIEEQLLDLRRREAVTRCDVMDAEAADFRDMLHVAAIWTAEKKAREWNSWATSTGCTSNSISTTGGRRRPRTTGAQTGDVWVPTKPPRLPDGCRLGFPKAAFQALCEEETELRRWLHGVQRRLRENIEHACQEAHYLRTCGQQLTALEDRARWRLELEADEQTSVIKRRFFLKMPADYYRQQVVRRYGASPPQHSAARPHCGEGPRGLSFEETEEAARGALIRDEEAARRHTHAFLVDRYDHLRYRVNHAEILAREAVIIQQAENLYPLVASLCRHDFGMCYYHTPALFLHLRFAAMAAPCMAEMCAWHLHCSARTGAVIRNACPTLVVEKEGDEDDSSVNSGGGNGKQEADRALPAEPSVARPAAYSREEYSLALAPTPALTISTPPHTPMAVAVEVDFTHELGSSRSSSWRGFQKNVVTVPNVAHSSEGEQPSLTSRSSDDENSAGLRELATTSPGAVHTSPEAAAATTKAVAAATGDENCTVHTIAAHAELVTVDEDLHTAAGSATTEQMEVPVTGLSTHREPVFSAEEYVPHVESKRSYRSRSRSRSHSISRR